MAGRAIRAGLVIGSLLLGSLVLAGCIDKTPGLEVTVRSAAVRVQGESATQLITMDLQLRVHVGKYALAGRNFIVPEADLFGGGSLAAEVGLNRPPDFGGMLEPGQTEAYTTTGMTMVGAFPDARSTLCTGAPVDVVVLWQAMLATEDIDMPFRMEMGIAEFTTDDVTCE